MENWGVKQAKGWAWNSNTEGEAGSWGFDPYDCREVWNGGCFGCVRMNETKRWRDEREGCHFQPNKMFKLFARIAKANNQAVR